MSEWKNYYLLDIASIHDETRVPLSKMEREMRKGDYPYYGASGIIDYVDSFLFEGEHVLISEDGENLKTRQTPIAFKANGRFWVNNHAHIVKGKKKFLNDLIVYTLKNTDLNPFLTGAVQPKLNQENLYKIPFYLPVDEREQRAIATVLSSLDDKIDLLHRQNKTLEAMAETLFRQWFVEEAEIKIVQLGDVIEIYDSKRIPLSSTEREKMKTGTLYPYYGAATIMDYINDFIFDGEYLLLGEDGTVQTEEGFPILQLAVGKYWVNNHTHVLNAKKPYSNFLLYSILKQTSVSHIVTGAVQPKINQENLKLLEIEVPSDEKIVDTVSAISNYWKRIQLNNNQIRTLESLRDTLLPKLMSGEVKVEI